MINVLNEAGFSESKMAANFEGSVLVFWRECMNFDVKHVLNTLKDLLEEGSTYSSLKRLCKVSCLII